MSNKVLKDQRRADLIIPYVPPPVKAEEADIGSTLSSSLPMLAMFSRNKMVGWSAVLIAIQSWLNETPAEIAGGKQPAYFTFGMSVMALGVTYLPLFFPGMGRGPTPATTSEPPAATPA